MSGVGDVTKIAVTGSGDKMDQQVVDLIEDRMTEEVDVALDTDRRLPYEARIEANSAAWEKRKGQLQKLLRVSS
jgi:anti-sigma factor RsiW